jgi:hypothetical protein
MDLVMLVTASQQPEVSLALSRAKLAQFPEVHCATLSLAYANRLGGHQITFGFLL